MMPRLFFVVALFLVAGCDDKLNWVQPPPPKTTTPTVVSMTPDNGPAGTVVVITGTNFSATIANNTVTVNGVEATITAATATSITFVVPAGTTGEVVVTTNGKAAASKPVFTYSVP